MPNVREYFDSDFKGFFWYEGPFEVKIDNADLQPPVMYRVLHHPDSRASCVSFYLPPNAVIPEICKLILDYRDWWLNIRDGVKIHDITSGESPVELTQTVFTGRIVLYLEGQLPQQVISDLVQYAKQKTLDLLVRDVEYAKQRDLVERPHAFISHDARDKDSIARPLATTLSNNLCRVWYDEFSLNVGDSLRASIENGLKKCRKCIIILTPNFLGNNRWAKREYDSIFTREVVEETQLILPVWSGVTRDDIYQYSPVLADRVAVIWNDNPDEVARRLLKVLF